MLWLHYCPKALTETHETLTLNVSRWWRALCSDSCPFSNFSWMSIYKAFIKCFKRQGIPLPITQRDARLNSGRDWQQLYRLEGPWSDNLSVWTLRKTPCWISKLKWLSCGLLSGDQGSSNEITGKSLAQHQSPQQRSPLSCSYYRNFFVTPLR